MDRRKFLGVTAGGLGASLVSGRWWPALAMPAPQRRQPDYYRELRACLLSLISSRKISIGVRPRLPIRWKERGKKMARAESIWDRFAHTTGKIKGAATGDVACDSYHLYKQDVALAKHLNLKSYRFSIAWPRIQPLGTGPANQKGLDYYKRLLDELHAANIRPMATLYHWDLPQSLEDRGGWPVRETASYFTDYANVVVKALGDRVNTWCILNEPSIFTWLGYGTGVHAPGRTDWDAFLKATHVVNLAQGMAFRAIKAAYPKSEVSSAFNTSLGVPRSNSQADKLATERYGAFATTGLSSQR